MHEENKKNDVAARVRSQKMISWIVHVTKIEEFLKTVASQAKNNSYFENLYVSRDDSERQIQLYAGQHPIGSAEITQVPIGKKTGIRFILERGAALVFSQSVLGDVIVILYPYASEKLRQADDYIVWGSYSDPSQITDHVLTAAVKDFFTYIRVSSALFAESATDRLRIRYLSFRGQKYIGGGGIAKLVFSHWFWVLLGAVGSVASIYSVIPSNPTPQPSYSTATNERVLSEIESITGGDSFAYVTPQPYDRFGNVPLAIRSVGKNFLTGVKLTIRDISAVSSLTKPGQVIDVGVMPADTIHSLEGVYLKAPTKPGDRVYSIEISAQNGIVDEVLDFRTRLVGTLGCVEDRLTVIKRKTISEIGEKISPQDIRKRVLINQEWHSFVPCKTEK